MLNTDTDDNLPALTINEGEIIIEPNMTPVEAFFHPVTKPSKEYLDFMNFRRQILNIIRTNSSHKSKLISDIVDALCKADIANGVWPTIKNILGKIKEIPSERNKRGAYRKVTISLLEQLFDPILECKLTKKDILDTFHANGINRDCVSSEMIEKIYVIILDKLKTGEIRDLTFEDHLLTNYCLLKIDEIKYSRQDWELYHR